MLASGHVVFLIDVTIGHTKLTMHVRRFLTTGVAVPE
jgi:hypothetical protein